jgi:hypothetical protein
MQLFLGKKLIVKSIRLNRLLPWLINRFQLKKILFIIRHPCAVVSSQMRTGWCGYHSYLPPYANIYPNQKTIYNEASKIIGIEPKVLDKLKTLKTTEELLAAAWCLDNYIPLSISKPNNWITIIYEKLLKFKEEEIIRILNEIGEKNIPKRAIQYINVPSRLTKIDDIKIVTKTNQQISKWRHFLTEKQISKILKIVQDFGLDFYNNEIEPIYEKINLL